MKYFLFFIATTFFLFGQNQKTISYAVKYKETLYSIAKKFNVSVEDIVKVNSDKDLKLLSVGQELLIPQGKIQLDQNTIDNQYHTVVPQETLFGIARKYNVSVDDLETSNKAILSNGLRSGQKIIIPNKKKTLGGIPRIITNETVFHKVQKGETKFSISKKYKTSIDQLEKQNPEIINGLVEGTVLAINSTEIKPESEREELMIALAEKQAIAEKNKAQIAKIEDLEDQLSVQKQMNQRILKLNSLDVDLKEIDEFKGSSVDKLKLILESNKSLQDILSSKLDSLVVGMYDDLEKLRNSKIDDVDTYKDMQRESQMNRRETGKMIVQLKRDLNDTRKKYVDLMNKVQRANTLQDQELKRRSKSVKKEEELRKEEEEEIKRIKELHENIDKSNESLFFKLEKLEKEKEYEITRRIEKATFYSASAREYDDRLAKQKLIRYQNNIRKEKQVIELEEEPLTVEELRVKIKNSNFNSDNIPAMERITNLKNEEDGFYIVLKITQIAEERDQFARDLSDAGELKTNFFYDINTFSYYVFSRKYKTFEQALYEVKQKESLPLFSSITIVELKLE